MVPANVNDKFVIRFAICSQNATDDDIGKSEEQEKDSLSRQLLLL